MKEIFEVDLKGNEGCTVKNIVSLSIHSEALPKDRDDGADERVTVILELELHNGSKTTVKTVEEYGGFYEHSCFGGGNIVRKRVR